MEDDLFEVVVMLRIDRREKLHKFTVEIKKVSTEVRVVTFEAESQKEAEQIVAEGVNALGFEFIGDETFCESEITVNNKWLEDDCSLTEM